MTSLLMMSSTFDFFEVFKATRFFNPKKGNEIKPTASSLKCLSVMPFFDERIEGLKSELPLYLAKATDVSDEFCALHWWEVNSSELPL